MYFLLENDKYDYEIKSVVQIFFKNLKFEKIQLIENDDIAIEIKVGTRNIEVKIFEYRKEQLKKKVEIKNNDEIKYEIKKVIYETLENFTEIKPKWGMLTGIRPTKEVVRLLKMGKSKAEVKKHFKKFYVADEKIDLLLKTVNNQLEIVSEEDETYYSLYINIPFCPSRCSYCSFTAFMYKKYDRENKVVKYLEYLMEEIKIVKNILSKKTLRSIYIGGGTPTSLNEEQLEMLLKFLDNEFNVKKLKEYTIEAGRVDTINEEKLNIMKKYGTTRISINAQTFKNETLKKIGRTHTKEEFIKIYKLAQSISFENINVDIILGLEDEQVCDVEKTINEIIDLSPDNITVHTLAIKKGSHLKESVETISRKEDETVKKMMKKVSDILEKTDYEPYYLYRQKNMVGNLENIGYGKNKKYSYYNIHIMEENEIIIGVGAGATSKIIKKGKKEIKSIFNFKGVEEYIDRFDEIVERKMSNVK